MGMSTHLLAFLQNAENESDSLIDACGNDPAQICEWVFNASNNKNLASVVGWAVDRPLKIIIVFIAAFIVSRVMKRAVKHFGEKLTDDKKNSITDFGHKNLPNLASDRGIKFFTNRG